MYVHSEPPEDGGGSMQKRVCLCKLAVKNVHGCTFLTSGKDCRGGEAVPKEWSREAEPRKA